MEKGFKIKHSNLFLTAYSAKSYWIAYCEIHFYSETSLNFFSSIICYFHRQYIPYMVGIAVVTNMNFGFMRCISHIVTLIHNSIENTCNSPWKK